MATSTRPSPVSRSLQCPSQVRLVTFLLQSLANLLATLKSPTSTLASSLARRAALWSPCFRPAPIGGRFPVHTKQSKGLPPEIFKVQKLRHIVLLGRGARRRNHPPSARGQIPGWREDLSNRCTPIVLLPWIYKTQIIPSPWRCRLQSSPSRRVANVEGAEGRHLEPIETVRRKARDFEKSSWKSASPNEDEGRLAS